MKKANSKFSDTRLLLTLLLPLLLFQQCNDKSSNTLFKTLPSSQTGITFNNFVEENDSMNMMTFTNFYTGAGVGIADINNDGFQDIYFGGCMTSGKLYLNKGNMQFEDITSTSGMETDRWVNGVSVVDINADGFVDFYLSVSGPKAGEKNRNLLFINNGDNSFTESASKYGIDEIAQTTHAAFFDYDNDKDLDLFLIINPTDFPLDHMGRAGTRKMNGEALSTDKLYRNNGDGSFTDVSREAGILIEGYSLGINTSDVNNDGWIDIFISNDFTTNDLLYINNGDGTFSNRSNQYLKHTSFASMGNDMADINNDGNLDLFVLDMYPEDNYREKMLINATSYNAFYYLLGKGYEAQYPRNVLQINNGNDTFSEIGQLAGIDKTDWSWAPVFADYDNDGLKDLFVANGFRRDVGNLDYLNYNTKSPFVNPNADKTEQLKSITDQPGTPLNNYAYKNKGDLTFEDVSANWGLNQLSFSNGVATADLDNDGDIDIVVNNINDEAFVHENLANEKIGFHYLKIKLKGYSGNSSGFGSKVRVVYDGDKQQFHEHQVYRGYLSSLEDMIHFGFGQVTIIDSLEIYWPDGKYSLFQNVKTDTSMVIGYEPNAIEKRYKIKTDHHIFRKINDETNIQFVHNENPFSDFPVQPLIPHEHALNGPGIAIGDLNGDQLDDFFVGGANGQAGRIFLQGSQGFTGYDLPFDMEKEDMGALIFDADNDGDNDLYVVSGGTARRRSDTDFNDRLYLNDGNGKLSKTSLPDLNTSGGSVTASDYDQDGDLDLFIGGRVSAGNYPEAPRSYLLNNQSGNFSDVTESIDGLSHIGMVSSSLWTDINDDGWVDLILVGEWMPITIFENNGGQLVNKTNDYGMSNSHGWWNSITGGDFDNDGDTDYVLGNLGTNSNYRASVTHPFRLYAKDFDHNGTVDPIMSQYYGDIEYPVSLRDPLIRQIPELHRKFITYDQYARATFADVFSPEQLEGATILKSEIFENSYLENMGNGSLKLSALPKTCQMSPIYGIITTDVNYDGNLDFITVGNSYATNVSVGRYDGGTGSLLLGDGKGNFSVSLGHQNGMMLDVDAKGLGQIFIGGDVPAYIISVNNDSLQVFNNVNYNNMKTLTFNPSTWKASLTYSNGLVSKLEIYYGSGYLSQSSRTINIQENVTAIVLNDSISVNLTP